MTDPRQIDVSGLPLPVVFAACFAAADSPPGTPGRRLAEPLALADAEYYVGGHPVNLFTATLRGRDLSLNIEHVDRINARGYDKVNAGGRALGQAIAERLRRESPAELALVRDRSDGAYRVQSWALEALRTVDPGRAWRIELIDQVPIAPLMGGCEVEYRLVRHAWVRADELIRSDPDVEPMAALDGALDEVFRPNGSSNASWEFIGKRMRGVVGEVLARSPRGIDAQRATWRTTAPILEGVVPTWPLQQFRTHPDLNLGIS